MSDTPKSKREVIMRPYEKADIDVIVQSVAAEVPKLPNYKDIKVSPERVKFLLEHNHGNASYFQCWVLIDKETNRLVGGSAGFCVPGMLSLDLVATDAFLFVYQDWRTLRNCLMLMTAYKEWAMARGCKLINSTHTGGHRPEAFAEVMRRQGYIEAGFTWMLRLDQAYLNRV